MKALRHDGLFTRWHHAALFTSGVLILGGTAGCSTDCTPVEPACVCLEPFVECGEPSPTPPTPLPTSDVVPWIDDIAGNGSSGYAGDGGDALSATLNNPVGLAWWNGNVYIADRANCRVRRINEVGVVTTVAGTGNCGYGGDGGKSTRAKLNLPTGLAVASDGTLYIADMGNHAIRRVSPDGTIDTFAGVGTFGFSGDNGPAVESSLYSPSSVALSPEGYLYIADHENLRIREVTPDGIIRTVAGNGLAGFSGDKGPAVDAQLNYPYAVAYGAGALYIADTLNNRIRTVEGDGIIRSVAGVSNWGYGGDGGPAIQAHFDFPLGIAVRDDGAYYVADSNNSRIRWVDSDGQINTLAGTGEEGYNGNDIAAITARLNLPTGLALVEGDSLLFSDTENQRVRLVSYLP